ncbi:unnamed protein product [Hymenolepis diminuta]|uniref:Uncharacterized protein n=1 Tax=Hymenolepis diminuta TaxID=6216 RepID=A0A0R3SPT8_HYMDI|nr:unnamed protein product [Hymenolepis diminuta]
MADLPTPLELPCWLVKRPLPMFVPLSIDGKDDWCLIFIFGLRSPCPTEIRLRLLSLLDKELDVKKSRCGPESAPGPFTTSVQPEEVGETHSPSYIYPTNIRSSHFQDANFAEKVVIIETVLSNTSLPELQRQWPQRKLLPRIFYEQFNEAEPEQQESIKSDKAKL